MDIVEYMFWSGRGEAIFKTVILNLSSDEWGGGWFNPAFSEMNSLKTSPRDQALNLSFEGGGRVGLNRPRFFLFIFLLKELSPRPYP